MSFLLNNKLKRLYLPLNPITIGILTGYAVLSISTAPLQIEFSQSLQPLGQFIPHGQLFYNSYKKSNKFNDDLLSTQTISALIQRDMHVVSVGSQVEMHLSVSSIQKS